MFTFAMRALLGLLVIVCFAHAQLLASLENPDPHSPGEQCEPAHTIESRPATGTCIYDPDFDDCDGDDYEEDGCGHELAETGVDGQCVEGPPLLLCTTVDSDGNPLTTWLNVYQGDEACLPTETDCACYVLQDQPPVLVASPFADCN